MIYRIDSFIENKINPITNSADFVMLGYCEKSSIYCGSF